MWATKVDLKNAYFHLQLSEKLKPYVRMQIGEKIPNGRRMFWSEYPTLSVDEVNVCFPEKVETARFAGFHLPGRHSSAQRISAFGRKANSPVTSGFNRQWHDSKLRKVFLNPLSKSAPLGIPHKPGSGQTRGTPPENKVSSQRFGETFDPEIHYLQESSRHFGTGQIVSDCPAFPKGFYRPTSAIYKHALSFWLGHRFRHPQKIPGAGKRSGYNFNLLGRQVFRGKQKAQTNLFRLFHPGVGGGLETQTGQIVQEFWRSEIGLHINIKELKAAVAAVQSLAKPGEVVHLSVDNQVAYHYLRKGGGNSPTSTKFCDLF
jgi:hypothetical protein